MLATPSPLALGLFFFLSELGLNLVKRSKPGAVSKDSNSLGLIWLLNLAGSGLAIFFMFRRPAWVISWNGYLYLAGLGLFLLGVALRWYSIFYLGRFFTTNVAIAPDQYLVNTGPYRFVRHPSYSGSMLMVIGLGWCLGNLASLLTLAVCFFIAVLSRIRVEEDTLTAAFDGQYIAYCKKTWRLIPFFY